MHPIECVLVKVGASGNLMASASSSGNVIAEGVVTL
jgi:hypothetical protein